MKNEMESLKRRIDAASKRVPADVVIKGGKIVDVFNLTIKQADIAITDGIIVGIGEYEGKHVIDAIGQYIAPSFIDAHVHIESSMVTPKEFAKVVLPHGVTTVITDPHEIANVSGTEGISFMLHDSEGLDLDVFVMLPSCVPATTFENSGAVLQNEQLEPFYAHPRVLGLAEVMDFPSVKNHDKEMFKKIVSAKIHRNQIDGHGSGFDENGINIYRTAGITTDHECVNSDEVEMRIARGMYVMIREGTTAKNLKQLIKMVTPSNARRFLFCTDDKHLDDLLIEGSVDHNIRLAIQYGMDPIQAIQLATLNAAECFSLNTKGAVAPGFEADLVFLEDLKTLEIAKVFKAGKLVAEAGTFTGKIDGAQPIPSREKLMKSVRVNKIKEEDLQLAMGVHQKSHIIEVIPDQIVTNKLIEEVPVQNGIFLPDAEKDLAKLAVIERHHLTGNIGLGIVKGLGLTSGAVASTVGHDSHNLIVAGTNDGDILKAVEVIQAIQGGLVVVQNGKVLATLELAISGLMSNKPYPEVLKEIENLHASLDLVTNGRLPHLFITLAFLSLPVIPKLKLTDQGLFDVSEFKHIPLLV